MRGFPHRRSFVTGPLQVIEDALGKPGEMTSEKCSKLAGGLCDLADALSCVNALIGQLLLWAEAGHLKPAEIKLLERSASTLLTTSRSLHTQAWKASLSSAGGASHPETPRQAPASPVKETPAEQIQRVLIAMEARKLPAPTVIGDA